MGSCAPSQKLLLALFHHSGVLSLPYLPTRFSRAASYHLTLLPSIKTVCSMLKISSTSLSLVNSGVCVLLEGYK